ncbi:MAG: ATP-binding protein [Treponema sp.]|nr:ATP-binding protein [Treponema sp.]
MHFTLSDLITDIAQNACESGAKLVELEINEKGGEFRFAVKDNGRGMTKVELEEAVDPFVTDGVKHPHRKIGLGLPFLIQTAEQSGGGWDVQSEKGRGTTATAWFDMGNVDTPPVGDLPSLFRTIFMFNEPDDIVIRRFRQLNGEEPMEYEVCRSELDEALGGLEDTGSLVLMGKYFSSLEGCD